jgi:hypothetical protein
VTATSLLPSSFSLQAKEGKDQVMTTSLLSSPCSQQKNKRKKRQWHACAVTLFTSNRNKKTKEEMDGVFFFSS